MVGGEGPAMAAMEALTWDLSAEFAPHCIGVVGLPFKLGLTKLCNSLRTLPLAAATGHRHHLNVGQPRCQILCARNVLIGDRRTDAEVMPRLFPMRCLRTFGCDQQKEPPRMKRFLIRCAIAGAMIAGAAAASLSAVSSSMSTGVAIGSSSAAPAAAAPAAPSANTASTTTSAAFPQATADPPPIPSNAMGCVGGAVSTSSHLTQTINEGFGDFFKDNSLGTPGAAIQAFAAAVCGKH